MKKNQFIKEIKSLGFYAKDFEKSILIVDSNDFFVAKVSKVSVGEISTDYPGFTNLEYSIKLNFLDFLFNYATMPIEDREEEEKHYYKLTGFKGVQYFLTKNIDTEEVFLDTSKSEQTRNWFLKSQFTDKEFEALPDDIKSHNWEKIKVEREDHGSN